MGIADMGVVVVAAAAVVDRHAIAIVREERAIR